MKIQQDPYLGISRRVRVEKNRTSNDGDTNDNIKSARSERHVAIKEDKLAQAGI